MQKEALELVKALFSDVNPIPVKKAVESIGLCEGYVREPLVELDYKKTQRLLFEMEDYRSKNRN
jgi:4-hydroxy-tetrahydrodipicolinate synthase